MLNGCKTETLLSLDTFTPNIIDIVQEFHVLWIVHTKLILEGGQNGKVNNP